MLLEPLSVRLPSAMFSEGVFTPKVSEKEASFIAMESAVRVAGILVAGLGLVAGTA
jgi:hypothetical protein